jgi:hypothetical protein
MTAAELHSMLTTMQDGIEHLFCIWCDAMKVAGPVSLGAVGGATAAYCWASLQYERALQRMRRW